MRKPSRKQRKAIEALGVIFAYEQAFRRANPDKPVPRIRWERGWISIYTEHGVMSTSYRIAQLREMTERLMQRADHLGAADAELRAPGPLR